MRLFAAISILFLAFSASALTVSNKITATVTFTNAPTTNGMTFTVNGSVRTWTNTVFVSGTQVLTNLLATGSKTNFYRHVGLAPFTSVVIQDTGPTNLTLTGNAGVAMTVTASAGYVSIVMSTQTVGQAWDVRVPYSTEVAAQQTNIWSLVGAGLNFQGITNSINEASQIATNLVGRTNDQTIGGKKTWTGSNWWNSAYLSGPLTTNLVNYGNAISSPGSGTSSEQLGTGARASGIGSLAVGKNATNTTAGGAAIGNLALVTGDSSVAVGGSASVSGASSVAIGNAAVATHDSAVALGASAATTSANQIRLGTLSESVSIPGNLKVSGVISNASFASSNNFIAGADIAFTRYAITSLASGVNAGVPVGTNVFIEVSGPGAAFTIDGIANGRDGKIIYIINQTGFDMGIAHQSGSEATAANRIITMTAATRTCTGNGAATLIYSAAASRWLLIGIEQ